MINKRKESISYTKSDAIHLDNPIPDVIKDSPDFQEMALLKITPSMAAKITGYSESTCKKVMLHCYSNKEVEELILQQINIFIRRIEAVLRSNEIYDILENVLDGKKVRSASAVRLLVELQNICKILNN